MDRMKETKCVSKCICEKERERERPPVWETGGRWEEERGREGKREKHKDKKERKT